MCILLFQEAIPTLFFEKTPSLIVVNYLPISCILLKYNVLAVFTSSSETKSRNLAERFEQKTGLALVTDEEELNLKNISTKDEEETFRELTMIVIN